MAIILGNTATGEGYGEFDTDELPEALDQLADNRAGGLTWLEWLAEGGAPVDELCVQFADGSTVLM